MSATSSHTSESTSFRRAVLVGAALLVVCAGVGAVRASAPSLAGHAGGASPRGPFEPAGVQDAKGVAVSQADAASAEPSAARVALGQAIFFDTHLSVPSGTSCASCHDPSHAFAGNHGSSSGVALGSRPHHLAKRSTPSVLYLPFVRKFHLHWEEDAPLVDAYGGFFWDGRADSLVDLIKQPLFNPDEMNAGDASRVAATMASSAYAADFRREFGAALDDPGAALQALGQAVSAYLSSPAMSPFTSKYDDFVRGRVELTSIEARGLAIFKDSAKGGCSACHKMNDRSPDPKQSLFTDYGFDAVGVPRNRALPANRDPKRFDLGLCERADAAYKAKTEEFCGRFRTPSLRNVAVRPSFMHNGVFARLRDVVAFYATRSTNPERWYPNGTEFDDLPAPYRDHVNVDKAPYNRRRGQTPALDDGEIDALVAFLGTLTDAAFR
jgi:cytochrome c peroxidase